ncbi:MAG: hypothetical protein ACRC8S_00040 [Fimbriiglobus sp.]
MAEVVEENWWPDEEYVPYLEAEQRLYSWVLVKVGGIEPDESMRRALTRFPYEAMAQRGMIHHAGAWRIAMCDLFEGRHYQPADFGIAAVYEAESRRLFEVD